MTDAYEHVPIKHAGTAQVNARATALKNGHAL
jgi:hypothetical protein